MKTIAFLHNPNDDALQFTINLKLVKFQLRNIAIAFILFAVLFSGVKTAILTATLIGLVAICYLIISILEVANHLDTFFDDLHEINSEMCY